jgi:uncharacterized repeat protein (TIGR03803 family)
MVSRRVVRGLVFLFILTALPVFAIRRGDTGTSQNGSFSSCQTVPNPGTCPFVNAEGAATLTGTDGSGNAVTVTISLYNWGYYPCSNEVCTPTINFAVLDVKLTGTPQGIESLVVKGVLENPSYVSCGDVLNLNVAPGIGCIAGPFINLYSDVQEPTPIAGADKTNTRWDFGGLPPLNPPPPAVSFDDLFCVPDGITNICNGGSEAVLAVSNSVAQNHLGVASSNYLITLTDGTKLGTLSVPASPTKYAVNNTQAMETVITKPSYKDYTDTSQTYPGINGDGSMNYPSGFALAPVPPPSSPTLPSCYPTNNVTGSPDTRTFRTVWYTYTAPSNGSITITTAGSHYDTVIYVFTGSASQPSTVGCDDDPFPGGGLLQAATSFNVTKGTNYQIVVGQTPTFQLYADYLVGYPLSVDGTLYFSLQFSTKSVIPATATAITSSVNPSSSGQSVNFSATMTPDGSGTPTGIVTFKNGSMTLGTAPLSGSTATLSTSALMIGANSITAIYSGDSNFGGSTSPALLQDVQVASMTTISSSSNPSKFGAAITFRVTVTSAAGTPTGVIQILNNQTALATKNLVSGLAEYSTSKLIGSNNVVGAVYGGDSVNLSSASNAINQVVLLPSNYRVMHSFGGGTDGTEPLGGLVADAHSNLYGTTTNGGTYGCGTVFEVLATGQELVLYSFTCGVDGSNPVAGLVRDPEGNLYGTTFPGGTFGSGTVFELDSTSHEMVLYSFTGIGGDGAEPQAGLILDTAGNLYGTTYLGGANGDGTVFEVTAPNQETVLYNFTGGSDGGLPVAGLVRDAQGYVFGTTIYYGNHGCGTLFEVTAPNQGMGLYNFYCGRDGSTPGGGLILDEEGNLYGVTSSGGSNNLGTVFKVTPAGLETVLYNFTGAGSDGASPVGSLVEDPQGNLYGTTASGGDLACDCGIVFKVSSTGEETILYEFTGTEGDGAYPQGGLVLSRALGSLYGTTLYGGDLTCNYGKGCGTVFKLNLQ